MVFSIFVTSSKEGVTRSDAPLTSFNGVTNFSQIFPFRLTYRMIPPLEKGSEKDSPHKNFNENYRFFIVVSHKLS